MQFLKQGTAACVMLGPAVDNTDGFTPEVGLTISSSDIRLSKEGSEFAAKNDSTSASHNEYGWYEVTLDTTDTETIGRLDIAASATGAFPMWREFMVLPANVYDSLISGSGTDYLKVEAQQVAASAITASAFDGGAIDAAAIAASAITSSQLSGSAIVGDTFATGAIRNDAIAACAIGTTTIAGSALPTAVFAACAISPTVVAGSVITAQTFAAAAVTGAAIASSALSSTKFSSNTIVQDVVAASAIGPNQVAGSVITTATFAAGAIDNAALAACAIGTTTIAGSVLAAAVFATDSMDLIADAIWDELLTGATHNTATSAGRRLRELASTVVHTGTATGGAATYITLDGTASGTDGAYDPSLVAIIGGTGAGQARLIMEYNGTSKNAYVDRNWKVNPDATSEFVIYADAGREHTNEGLLQGGSAIQVQLNSLASSSDDVYNNCMIFIRAGTGEDQVRFISDYSGSDQLATVSEAFSVTPAANDVYAILPFTTQYTQYDVADAVWDEARSGHTSAGTFGQGVASVQGSVTGDIDGDVSGSVTGIIGGSMTGGIGGSIAGGIGGNVDGSVGSVTGAVGSVSASGITACSFDAGAIDAAAIADNAIDAGAIAASTLSFAKFASNAIVQDIIAACTIGPNQIAGSAITAQTFEAGAITSTALAASALASQVNAEVVDVLNGDTFSEPGQGAPTATPTIEQMIHYLYKQWRNKTESTGSAISLYDDAGTTVDQRASISDDATTYTKGEVGSGA